ncbi:hypothetical protein EDEG_02616 [Edhazardia aedis USNM 41457]|uniref:Transmembrane protein n=1 Tax=Edhazardia aedis (strain USNM 41457) TaxID=1003232 RepID=J9DNK5_EDHAE|nr:hypothetical protein EDEG_02616 [Edhazardia aedis USNM 41457]|eukprot:EJW02972.1 hypothetical protein EDEG_02616 [Edhazardia aedis USNM 41457]
MQLSGAKNIEKKSLMVYEFISYSNIQSYRQVLCFAVIHLATLLSHIFIKIIYMGETIGNLESIIKIRIYIYYFKNDITHHIYLIMQVKLPDKTKSESKIFFHCFFFIEKVSRNLNIFCQGNFTMAKLHTTYC